MKNQSLRYSGRVSALMPWDESRVMLRLTISEVSCCNSCVSPPRYTMSTWSLTILYSSASQSRFITRSLSVV